MIKHDLILDKVSIPNITQRTVCVIGGKGTGKTQTLKMLAVQAEALKLRLIVFDLLNVIRIEGWHRVVVHQKNMDSGAILGKAMTKLKQKNIIVAFADMNQDESSKFIDAMFKEWHPQDALIFVDEVHEIAPERGMQMDYSTEFERAVRHWRNRNVGFILTTQRPAFTSKKVLGLTDYVILYRLTWPNDVKVVKELIGGMIPGEVDRVVHSVQNQGFLQGYGINFIPEEDEQQHYQGHGDQKAQEQYYRTRAKQEIEFDKTDAGKGQQASDIAQTRQKYGQ